MSLKSTPLRVFVALCGIQSLMLGNAGFTWAAPPTVNWVINSGNSTITFSGASYVGGPYPFQEVSPGSMATSLSGTFVTNSTFTQNVIFGNGTEPSYPSKPSDSSQYATWADATFPASAAAQNHVLAGISGSYQPTYPLPSVPVPISPLPSSPGPASPGNFGGLMLDDQSDPENPIFTPFAIRNYSQVFWTNISNSTNTDPLYPAYLPTGAAVNANGTFSSAAIGSGVVTYWDVFAPDFLGGALTGRWPLTETIKNFSGSDGVIGRNGAAYTMTFTDQAIKYLVGKTAPSSLDIGVQQSLVVHATANLAPGDANFDGIVNGQDIALAASNWLATNAAKLGAGDANGDGIVNGQDIALMASNWLATTPPLGSSSGEAAAVPEPAGALLFGLALLGLVGRRVARRKS